MGIKEFKNFLVNNERYIIAIFCVAIIILLDISSGKTKKLIEDNEMKRFRTNKIDELKMIRKLEFSSYILAIATPLFMSYCYIIRNPDN